MLSSALPHSNSNDRDYERVLLPGRRGGDVGSCRLSLPFSLITCRSRGGLIATRGGGLAAVHCRRCAKARGRCACCCRDGGRELGGGGALGPEPIVSAAVQEWERERWSLGADCAPHVHRSVSRFFALPGLSRAGLGAPTAPDGLLVVRVIGG